MSEEIDFSIIIPCYHGAATMRELLIRVAAAMQQVSRRYEVIVVDDSSDHAHWRRLTQTPVPDGMRCSYYRLAKNFSQHHATLCGLQHASGTRAFITIDDDLEYAPEDIPKLIESWSATQADVLYGVPADRAASLRRTGSRWLKLLSKKADAGYGEWSSYRVIHARMKTALARLEQPVVDLDVWLYWCTDALEHISVPHTPRTSGTSGYSLVGLLSLIFKKSFNYSTWPLKIMISVGATLSVVTFLLGLYFIGIKLFLHVEVPGFTAIIVAILFSMSLIMISLGILGIYISQLFIHLNRKPTYHISETVTVEGDSSSTEDT